MQKLKPFPDKDYSASGNYDQDFTGEPIAKVGFRFAAALTGTSVTVRDDAAFRLLGTIEVVQAEQSLIRMRGASWRLLSAIQSGSFDAYAAPTTTPVLATAIVDLPALLPGAMINAADKKASLRGTFGALADYAATPPSAVAGKLRGFVETSENDATKGFWRPRFVENALVLGNSDLNSQKFTFEQDTVVPAIMIQVFDGSTVSRVDTIARKIRVDHVGDNGAEELHRLTWGQLKSYLSKRFTPEDAARAVGCVMIPLIDRRNPHVNNARIFKAGESLTINYDCTATIEEDLGTAVTADGTTDLGIATVLGFQRVKGTGDTETAQQRVIGVVPASAPMSRTARRKLARAQRVGAE